MGKLQPLIVSFRLGYSGRGRLRPPAPRIYTYDFREPDSSQHPMLDQRFSMANPTPFCLFGSPTSDAGHGRKRQSVMRRDDEYLVEKAKFEF
ncbi:hypothetical protein J1N35_027255 [Gossypium stocksii]|uniref:Uncharacterized protein n=1 Tax=Gossypium stocksii TaxID=47602 RepID=A0A9D3ZYY3_9ROSI|nr:hypothetical protein J1N35_027255 [Gossypium stocksii]